MQKGQKHLGDSWVSSFTAQKLGSIEGKTSAQCHTALSRLCDLEMMCLSLSAFSLIKAPTPGDGSVICREQGAIAEIVSDDYTLSTVAERLCGGEFLGCQ